VSAGFKTVSPPWASDLTGEAITAKANTELPAKLMIVRKRMVEPP
jgi:hypothetical protein